MSTLGERLRKTREKRGLSKAELGRRVGLSTPAIHQLESGIATRSAYIVEIAVELKVSAEWLALGVWK